MSSAADELPVDCVRRVLLHLASACGGDPRVIRGAASVSKSWLRAADSPEVYAAMLRERYGVDDLSLPFTRDRVDWGEDNYLTTVPPVDTSDTLDFPVFPFYDAHDGSPDKRRPSRAPWPVDARRLRLHRRWSAPPPHSPKRRRDPRAPRRARPRPARVFRRMARRVRRSRPRQVSRVQARVGRRRGILPRRRRRRHRRHDHARDIQAPVRGDGCVPRPHLGRTVLRRCTPIIELLYRLRGGQTVFVSPSSGLDEDGVVYRAPDERELCTFPMGLFGGHFFYGKMPCVRFLPLDMFLFNCAIPTAGCTGTRCRGGSVSGYGDGLVVYVDTRDGRPYVCDRGGLKFGPED